AVSAIPQLLAAVTALNERRSGRSDRSADFRTLAVWFAACRNDAEGHRLARAAFALNPARHLLLDSDTRELPANTPWAAAPAIRTTATSRRRQGPSSGRLPKDPRAPTAAASASSRRGIFARSSRRLYGHS